MAQRLTSNVTTSKSRIDFLNAPNFLEAYQEEADRMVQQKQKEMEQK
jgi:hypothetical protein